MLHCKTHLQWIPWPGDTAPWREGVYDCLSCQNSLELIQTKIEIILQQKTNLKIYLTYLKNKFVPKSTGKFLYKSYKKNIHKIPLTNKKYFQKLLSIKKKIPTENQGNINSKSDIISRPYERGNLSRRLDLYQNYDVFQIALMNKTITQFQTRLDLTRWLNIQLYGDNNNLLEEIKLKSPAEIYRFCLKLLRKEMAEVKTNQLFNGKVPIFDHYLAAAYELGTINSEILNELEKLNEIWDPTKSKWEKVKFWTSILVQASAVFVPPPYNYLLTFSMMAIEQLHPNETLPSYEHSIFGEIK